MLEISEICAATNGICDEKGTVCGVSIDTRTIQSGELYIAIKGDNFDGHSFAKKAEEAGAAAIVSEKPLDVEIPVIIVTDTREALAKLAQYNRRKINPKLVAITGSVGKTSTKDMVYAVLSSAFPTLKTEGNLNNEIGLPLTLLKLKPEHKAAVIEMGMSGFGEISALSRIAEPDLAIITNIGVSHLEMLKTQENILKAKLEILDGMHKTSPIILNCEDRFLFEAGENLDKKVIFYGISNHAGVFAEDIQSDENGEQFTICYNDSKLAAKIPTRGRHSVLNALAAFCAGVESELAPEAIIRAFLSYKPSAMRQKFVKMGEQTVIIDCYNASPDSMKASLSVLGSEKGRKIAVLGDMLELGAHSAEMHESVASMLEQNLVDEAFLYGEQMANCAARCAIPNRHFTDKKKLANELKKTLNGGETVLFKGSRGMRMEEIINMIWQGEIPNEA